jgi:L-histidine Nalpha-methyltransferase
MSAQAHRTIESRIAQDVRSGLCRSPRELPSEYLYDDLGTALFEAITYLPEYGLTRAEERILLSHAAEIKRRLRQIDTIAELGSGTGRKTRHILSALSHTGGLHYYPIDVSPVALRRCKWELGELAAVRSIEARYLDGLNQVLERRPPWRNITVLFLGSTIGNFSREDGIKFLCEVRGRLRPNDVLMLGADLVKSVEQLIAAYDDPIGLTAAFNLNILARINRELHSDFNPRRFAHQARYDSAQKRVEMHLRSLCRQRVEIADAGFGFPLEEGETIWTESSYKFDRADLEWMASQAGFELEALWTDSEWPFALALWRAA